MTTTGKIIAWESLSSWREQVRLAGRKLVVTNGCFDLLHAGHVTYLEQAKDLGDLLLVGVNGDQSVRQLKGQNRPINSAPDRARVLAGLGAIDAVCIFQETTATAFLTRAQPDVYVKGGDYTLDSLDPTERTVLEQCRARIVLLPFVPGKSTTVLLNAIAGGKEKEK